MIGKYSLAKEISLGSYLKAARLKRRLSVAEVAERIGVTAPAVYLWEMERNRPRDYNLTALCKVLRLPVRATRELAAQ
jgi:transcriptional regulator with XRE-family HTH domain